MFLALSSYAQDQKIPDGWDQILLDGKTAYMNLITGDVSKTFPTKAAVKPVEIEEYDPTITHEVKKGETLSTIARTYDMHLAELYRLNSMVNFDSIEVGDKVVIGYEQTKTSSRAFKDAISYHIVQSGETLYRISVQYKIPVAELKTLNNLKSNTIFVGQKIILK